MSPKRLAACCAALLIVIVFSACAAPAPAATEAATEEYAPATSAPAYEHEAQTEAAAPDSSSDQYFAAPLSTAPASGGAANQAGNQGKTRDDTTFEDYGTNPMIDTEDDNLSTFGLDVDTGSYTIMRGYVNDGSLPPSDSVRVEEFVNYFEQGYPNPRRGDTFGVYVDGGPTPFNQTERYQTMRVGIQGYAVPEDERKDVSLVFVIDVSGSMDMDNRLGLVKRSLEVLVDQLRRDDRIGIVVYGSEARVVLEPTSARHKDEILDAIYSLQTDGATNAEAGLKLGYKMALRAFDPETVNRVILCSDGVANVGETGPDEILETVSRYSDEEQITLTTVGFGMDNYNDVLMEQLADKGDGFYAYVDTIEEARRLFIDQLTSTLQVIAMDAKVQVNFNPDIVARYRLVGYENRDVADEDFRDDKVDAGEIGAGHSVTALYEFKLYPEASGRIATIYLRWKDPDTQEVKETVKDFYTGDMARDFEDADPHFQWSVLVAEYAELLRGSTWAEDSSIDDVYDEVRRVSDLLPEDEAVQEFVDLVRLARRMRD
jgi:Ca-activated chloride channel family protein